MARFSLESLTATIGRAKVDGSTGRVVARICRCDLIVVDDIGMLPAGIEAAEAFCESSHPVAALAGGVRHN